MIIREKAPVRISFVNGGDTDYYIEKIGFGNCINATITLYSFCDIRLLKEPVIILESLETGQRFTFNSLDEIKFDHDSLSVMKAVIKFYGNSGIRVITYTDAPLESGLGGSAAHAVAMIKAFDKLNGIKRSKEDTARLAYHIERNVLGKSGGYQDQYAAAYRGLNYMLFKKGDVTVTPLNVSSETIEKLEDGLVLVYIPRDMGGHDIHEDQKQKSAESVDILLEKRENVDTMRRVLESGEIEKFPQLLEKDWFLKKKLSGIVSNKLTEHVYNTAKENGAIGGRFVGAGAGGCAIFFCKDKDKLSEKFDEIGITTIPFSFERGW